MYEQNHKHTNVQEHCDTFCNYVMLLCYYPSRFLRLHWSKAAQIGRCHVRRSCHLPFSFTHGQPKLFPDGATAERVKHPHILCSHARIDGRVEASEEGCRCFEQLGLGKAKVRKKGKSAMMINSQEANMLT